MRLKPDLHTEVWCVFSTVGGLHWGEGRWGMLSGGVGSKQIFFFFLRRRIKTCSQIDSSANHGSAASGKSLNLSVPHPPPLQ